MSATTVPQSEPRSAYEHSARVEQPTLHDVARPDLGREAETEVNRWIRFLSVPFVLSALFFMATISTGHLWLIGGALATGPGLLILAFIYLAISSEKNGIAS